MLPLLLACGVPGSTPAPGLDPGGPDGAVFVADTAHHVIRRIAP